MGRVLPTATGILRYDPQAATIEGKRWWLILDCGLGWFHKAVHETRGKLPQQWRWVIDNDRTYKNVRNNDQRIEPRIAPVGSLKVPAWGCHISVLRGERPRTGARLWKGDEGRVITFEYDPEPWYNDEYIWLDIVCPELEEIRTRFGLSPKRHPWGGQYRPHLTVARWEDPVPDWLDGQRRRFGA